ncbi:MAG: LysR family transcriptional regulator [Pseudomonadota bacterium]|nr:LysR family transcriptional regulator [Pseudomonadota bacterium]
MPNFNELAAFAAVVREGSFTRAGAQLGVSPSALSHSLRKLEQRLGLTLLHRSTRSVAATEAGQRLYDTVAPRLEDITLALAALTSPGEGITGTVRLNGPDHALQHFIWPRLSPLLRAHPGLRVELHCENRFTDIVAGRYDLGVRLGRDVAQDMIATRIAPDLVMAVAGSPAFFQRHGAPRAPDGLNPALCLGFRLPTHDNLLAWEFHPPGGAGAGKPFTLQPAGPLVANQPQSLIDAARESHGLIWLPRSMIQADIAQGTLHTVLDDCAATYEGYHLYYAARRHSPAMKAVIEALRLSGEDAVEGV